MFKTLKKLKKIKTSPAMREARHIDYDKNGRAQIFVGLKDQYDFYSPYSYLTYELMNPEVVEYINMCEAEIPEKDELAIEIYTEEDTTNEEKKRIRSAVKRHNAESIVRLKKSLAKNTATGLIWFCVGLVLLLLEVFLHLSTVSSYGLLIDLAGWVFAWDGIEILFDDRAEIKRKIRRNYRLMNAKVHVRKYSLTIQRQYGFGEFEEDDDEEDE